MTLKILAATDLSGPSLLAVSGAARLTVAAAARLDIVHVIRQWRWTPLAWLRNAIAIEVAAERRLAAAVAAAVKEGAQARGHLVTGVPVATLVALSREFAADLVVLGAGGSRGLLDPVLGTTAERLIERLPCAALVVRQRARTPYRTLLACVDTSPAAIEALRRAMALAPDARVHVVHAHELPLSATLRRLRLHAQATAHLSAERTRVRAALEAALTDAGIDMRRVKLTLRSGPPSRVIERAAARLAPDLIAVGHSASLLDRFFLGSIARHVLRMDIGDVLVARAG